LKTYFSNKVGADICVLSALAGHIINTAVDIYVAIFRGPLTSEVLVHR